MPQESGICDQLFLFDLQRFVNSHHLRNLQSPRRSLSEKAMATHCSSFAWKIPWTEEPGGLHSMGSQRVGHYWVISLSLFTFMRWRRKWQPTPEFLPGESQGRRSLVGCPSMGSHRVGHDWSDLAATAEASGSHQQVSLFPFLPNRSFLLQAMVCVCFCAQLLSSVWLFANPWTVACHAHLFRVFSWLYYRLLGFPDGSEVKVSASNVGDPGWIPGSGRSPGEGNGNPLQYSCLKNPIDGGA